MYSSNAKCGSGISCDTPLSVRERGHRSDHLIRKQETWMKSAVASEKRVRQMIYHTRYIRLVFKHLPWDPANVSA